MLSVCVETGQDYFDIVYSKKIGYVMILTQDPGEAFYLQFNFPNLFHAIIPPT